MGTMSDEDAAKIADALAARLRASKNAWWVEPETHAEHHAYLTRWIKRQEDRELFWTKVKQTAVGFIVVTALGGIVWGVGKVGWLIWLEIVKAIGRTQA